jgi:hypothetical protein
LFLLPYYCFSVILWHLQKCLQYILVKFTPSIVLHYLPFPILRIVSTGLIFKHEHTFPPYSPPTPFPYILSLSTSTNHQTIPVCLLTLHSCEIRHFCLFKIYRVSLWHFHVYMHVTQICSSPLFFSFLP